MRIPMVISFCLGAFVVALGVYDIAWQSEIAEGRMPSSDVKWGVSMDVIMIVGGTIACSIIASAAIIARAIANAAKS